MQPISLFGSSLSGISTVLSAQRRLNCFFDIRKDQEKGQLAIIGTFGLNVAFLIPSAPIRGWHVVGQTFYVVGGTTLYSVTSGGLITSLGAIPGAGYVSMADNFVQLMMVNGANLYCYTLVTGSYQQAGLNTAGSFGQVTDAAFPNGATTITFIDGRFIVEQAATRQLFISSSYDGTYWGYLAGGLGNYFSKENYSDIVQAVDVFNGLIIIWGDTSIEFWQDVGGSPLPYQRVQGATQLWGLAAKASRAFANNATYFLAKNPSGQYQVIKLSGYTPERVSDSDLEAIIDSFTTVSDAVALVYTAYGHALYQLTFPTANRTFIFDTTTGLWSETQTGLGLTGRHMGNLGITFLTNNYCSDATTGYIYQFSPTAYTDNGTPIKRQVTSRHIRNDGNWLTIGTLLLDMETGVSLEAGQGNNAQISCETSKDGGRTFGIPSSRPLGLVGQYRTPRVRWNRKGRAKDFVFRFTMTDPVKFIITGAQAADLLP